MKRKAPYPLEKQSIYLREGDMKKLQTLHPRTGAGPAIRNLVIKHLEWVEEEMKNQLQFEFDK